LIFKAVWEHGHRDTPVLIRARQNGARDRKTPPRAVSGRHGSPSFIGRARFGWTEPQVGVVGDLQRPLSSTLAQIAFGAGLQAPGNAPEQRLPIRGSRFLSDHRSVSDAQVRGLHLAQLLDQLPKFFPFRCFHLRFSILVEL
jgi:hypothetical protein